MAPVRKKPAAKPDASDDANKFNTDDEPLATPTSPGPTTTKPVQKKPAAKPTPDDSDEAEESEPTPDVSDEAEESVQKKPAAKPPVQKKPAAKPAAKLSTDVSDDAEGNEFQTTDEEPPATAVPRSKAKAKPTGGDRRCYRSRAAKQSPQTNQGATSSTLTMIRLDEMLHTSPKPAALAPTPIGSLSTS